MSLNWNQFEAKFEGSVNDKFEELSYILFCKRFNQSKGILRYKNQKAIENEPIEYEGKIIGYQAKFFEKTLGESKKEIIKTLNDSNESYNLDKLLFYTNKDPGANYNEENNMPKYLREIYQLAEDLNIELEFIFPSHFEIILSNEEYEHIKKEFFSLDESIFQFVDNIKENSSLLLDYIKDEIPFNENPIKLDREAQIIEIKENLNDNNVLIISGEGGSGKSALIKNFKDEFEMPLFIFKSTEFDLSNIQQFFNNFGNYNLNNFQEFYNDFPEKIFVIDSAEKLAYLENLDAFKNFLHSLFDFNWKVIFTTRPDYVSNLNLLLMEIYDLKNIAELKVDILTVDELQLLSEEHQFNLPEDNSLIQLLCRLFYLNLFLNPNIYNSNSVSEFKNKIWEIKIKNSTFEDKNIHIRREKCFLKLVKDIINKNPDYSFECDDAFSALQSDEIIGYNENIGRYFITQDIFEELALEKLIDNAFSEMGDISDFFNRLPDSLIIRKSFRRWFSNKLIDDAIDANMFLDYLFMMNNDESNIDDILIAILGSKYSKYFFEEYSDNILFDKFILEKIIFWLRIAYVKDSPFVREITNNDIEFIFTSFVPLKNWINCIDFLYDNQNLFQIEDVRLFIDLLNDWNSNNFEGETTRKSSLIALNIYDKIENGSDSHSSEDKQKIINVILNGSLSIQEEMEDILKKIVENKWVSRRDSYYDLSKKILSMNASPVFKLSHNIIFDFLNLFWFKDYSDENYWDLDNNIKFGISNSLELNFLNNPYQTPIFQLLKEHPNETIDFLIDFVNKSVRNYESCNDGKDSIWDTFSNKLYEIEIIIEDNVYKQLINDHLWQAYRGTTAIVPDLLISIHMALEKFLLDEGNKGNFDYLEELLKKILSNSYSASLTAVVTSVVLEFPNELFDVAKILFSSLDLFFYDLNRFSMEHQAKGLINLPYLSTPKIFINERKESCNLVCRKRTLRDCFLNYQLGIDDFDKDVENRSEILNQMIKIHENMYQQLVIKEESDYKLLIHQIDLKKHKLVKIEDESSEVEQFMLAVDLPQDLKEDNVNFQKEMDSKFKYNDLILWANNKLNNKNTESSKFDNNPELIFNNLKNIVQEMESGKNDLFFVENTLILLASVLIKFYSNELNKDELEYCEKIIFDFFSNIFSGDYYLRGDSNLIHLFNSLMCLYKIHVDEKDEILFFMLIFLFNNNRLDNFNRCYDLVIYSIRNIGILDEDLNKLISNFIYFKPHFKNIYDDIKWAYSAHEKYICAIQKFVNEYENQIFKIEKEKEILLDNLNLEDLNIIFQLIPWGTDENEYLNMVKEIIRVYSNQLFEYDSEINNANFLNIKRNFLERYALFVLSRENIIEYINPFINSFKFSRDSALFFESFISVDMGLDSSKFWNVWNLFYGKIVDSYRPSEINRSTISAYLLKPFTFKYELTNIKQKRQAILFYSNISNDLKFMEILRVMSKLIIDDLFIDEGINWICNFIDDSTLVEEPLDDDTKEYLELYVKRYVLKNWKVVKTNNMKYNQLLKILNYLIKKGSVFGFQFREAIL